MPTNPTVARHFMTGLSQTAAKLSREETLSNPEIAFALLTTGIAFSERAHGSAETAEWLRTMADEIERRDPRMLPFNG